MELLQNIIVVNKALKQNSSYGCMSFILSLHTVDAPSLPSNVNASAFLQFSQFPCVVPCLCSLLCSPVTFWEKPWGCWCFQVVTVLLRCVYLLASVYLLSCHQGKENRCVEFGGKICVRWGTNLCCSLYSTVCAHGSTSLETVLLWQICWNDFSS